MVTSIKLLDKNPDSIQQENRQRSLSGLLQLLGSC